MGESKRIENALVTFALALLITGLTGCAHMPRWPWPIPETRVVGRVMDGTYGGKLIFEEVRP
jgi:hypothetical protein